MKPRITLSVIAFSLLITFGKAQTKYPVQGWNPNPGYYESVTMSWGAPGYSAYNNYHSSGLRKSAKYTIRSAGSVINDAVSFHSWNDAYSPLLAKAIRHYHFSRQLYMWRDYHAAINHAERARFLAWYSLQFFHPGYGGNMYPQENYPNPYSDPYDPYYRKPDPGNEDAGRKLEKKPLEKSLQEAGEIDNKLPSGYRNDKELIRSFQRSDPE